MPPTELEALQYSFHLLSIASVIFCTLSALFGVYLVLFVLAILATYESADSSVIKRRMRIVTLVLFFVLVTHYASRAVQFGRSRLMTPPSNEQKHVEVPLLFVSSLTTTFAGFIADGLLAWRFSLVFGGTKVALWVPLVAVSLVCLLGVTETCLFLSFYHSSADFARLEPFIFKMNVAWGWATFVVNTVMTIAIVTKILLAYRKSKDCAGDGCRLYKISMHAITESALVTWIGLALLEIASLAPTKGHITVDMNFGFVMDCIIPIVFGISQCLFTVRRDYVRRDDQVSATRMAIEFSDIRFNHVSGICSGISRSTSRISTMSTGTDIETNVAGKCLETKSQVVSPVVRAE